MAFAKANLAELKPKMNAADGIGAAGKRVVLASTLRREERRREREAERAEESAAVRCQHARKCNMPLR